MARYTRSNASSLIITEIIAFVLEKKLGASLLQVCVGFSRLEKKYEFFSVGEPRTKSFSNRGCCQFVMEQFCQS